MMIKPSVMNQKQQMYKSSRPNTLSISTQEMEKMQQELEY